MGKRISRTVLGLCIAAVGIGYLGNQFSWWHFDLFFEGWWTLFIIVPCLVAIIESGPHLGNLLGLAFGICLLLHQQGVLRHGFIRRIALPAALVILGLYLVFSSFSRRRSVQYKAGPGGADFTQHPEYLAIFSSDYPKNAAKQFAGGSATAVFGNLEVDLRECALIGDCKFEATSVFGRVRIFAPVDCQVQMHSVPILGSNRCSVIAQGQGPVLHIEATSVFGQVEVL